MKWSEVRWSELKYYKKCSQVQSSELKKRNYFKFEANSLVLPVNSSIIDQEKSESCLCYRMLPQSLKV